MHKSDNNQAIAAPDNINRRYTAKLNEAGTANNASGLPQRNNDSTHGDAPPAIKDTESQRIIKEDNLKIYFNATFKGMGNGNINHFNTLISELKNTRAVKEFGQIALLIYKSGKMNDRKPKTFREWYRIFRNCIGCEYVKSYEANKLSNPTEELKNLFNYLQ
ncbi:hypothetical protein Barb6XT_03144 [Bacteroidales bacterium Barb6XT]|nr:hypothetical protein Barb6XT_03144 [Bacteroidales bacterium Barb6XT]